MNNNNSTVNPNNGSISTLSELKAQADLIREQIRVEESEMHRHWNSLTNQSKNESKSKTQRLIGFLTKGSTIIDGALLGWKLYRKFKR